MGKLRSSKKKRTEPCDEQLSPAKRAKLTSAVEQDESGNGEPCQSPAKKNNLGILLSDDSDFIQLISSLKSESKRQNTNIEEILALQRGERPKFEELDECVSQLQLIYNRTLKCEDSMWVSESDQSIAFAVKDLQSCIRARARRYSVESLNNFFAPKQSKKEFYRQQALIRHVQENTSIKDSRSLKEVEYPFAIFAAMHSVFILRAIFEDPFFHWRDPRNVKGNLNVQMIGKKMYEEMLSEDVANAVAFKVNILRHNFPESCCPQSARPEPDELLCPKSVSKNSLKSSYNYLRKRFLDRPPPIEREMDDSERLEMNQGPSQIFYRAGNLHLRLMIHRTQFEWVQPRTVFGRAFKVRDPALQADQINDVLDERDNNWKGETIQMVIGTGLMARGDSLGNDFSKKRIIAPSRVCLQNDWS